MPDGPDNAAPLSATITTVNEAIEATLADLALSALSKRTYRHGLHALLRFLHTAAGNDIAADALAPYPIARLSEDVLYAFFGWLREAYPAPRAAKKGDNQEISRTARTYLVAARRLMNWLDLHGLLPANVAYDRMTRLVDGGRGTRRQGYRQRKVDPEAIRVLTYYERQTLPEEQGPRRLALLRNRALMAFLYDTGVRIAEALALTREDVLDGRAHKVRLTETKNGKPRTVFLGEETRVLLRDYIREREDPPTAALFCSHGRGKGAAISAHQAWLLVKKAAKAEGLYGNTSPHSLRHRRAQDLLDEGMPLEWVAALLGHEHPDTTRIVYAWETDEERLADMVSTYGKSPSEAAGGDEGAQAASRAH
jgi:integrase